LFSASQQLPQLRRKQGATAAKSLNLLLVSADRQLGHG